MPTGKPAHRAFARCAAAVCTLGLLGFAAGCATTAPAPRADEVVVIDGLRYRIERVPRGPTPLGLVAPGWLSDPQRGLLALHRETADAYFVRVLDPAAPPAAPAVAASPTEAPAAPAALQPAGQFHEVDSALPRSGEWREQFALAATDGGVRLIAPPARKTLTPPVIWDRDAQGTWSPLAADFPAQDYDYGALALADLDADGQRDIALGMHLLGFAALRAGPDGRWQDLSAGLPHSNRPEALTGSGVAVAALSDPAGDRLLLLPEYDGRGSRMAAELGLAEFRWRDGGWRAESLGRGFTGAGLRLAQLPGCAPLLAVKPDSNNRLPLFRRSHNAWSAIAAPATDGGLWLVAAMQLDQFDGAGCADLLVAVNRHEPGGWRSRLVLWLGDGNGGWREVALPELPADLSLVELWAEHRRGELRVLAGSAGGDLLRLQGPPTALRWVGHLPAPIWRRGCTVSQIEAVPGMEDRWVVAFAGDGDRFDPQRCRSNGGLVEVRWEATTGN